MRPQDLQVTLKLFGLIFPTSPQAHRKRRGFGVVVGMSTKVKHPLFLVIRLNAGDKVVIGPG